jgi:hypothetical protein
MPVHETVSLNVSNTMDMHRPLLCNAVHLKESSCQFEAHSSSAMLWHLEQIHELIVQELDQLNGRFDLCLNLPHSWDYDAPSYR